MNKQKLSYTAPVAETFVVQAEGVICESPLTVMAWGSALEAGPSLTEDAGHTYNY